MAIRIVEEGPENLEDYGKVSIAFEVKSRLRVDLVDEKGMGGVRLTEKPVDPPWVKDYEAEAGERPIRWRRWDLSNWGFCATYDAEQRVGGAVVAFDTEDVNFLEAGRILPPSGTFV